MIYTAVSVSAPDCSLDLIFMFDGSASVTEPGYEMFKQTALDIGHSLPTDAPNVRVGFITSSVDVDQSSAPGVLSNSDVLQQIAHMPFHGGSDFGENALILLQKMLDDSTASHKVAVFFGDGQRATTTDAHYDELEKVSVLDVSTLYVGKTRAPANVLFLSFWYYHLLRRHATHHCRQVKGRSSPV